VTTIRFHSEQKMTSAAREILGIAKREVYGDEPVKFVKVDSPAPGVLCFGTRGGIRTLSPKQIVTAPNALSVLVQSLRIVKDGINLPEFDYRVVENESQFYETLNWMMTHGFDAPVCVDIENAPDKTMLSVAVTYGQEIVVFPEEYVQDSYLALLCGALHRHYYIVGANWKYDAGVLLDHTGIKLPVWFDTMLAHHSLHPSATGQHGLKSMAERILGIPDWDKDIQKYTGAGSKGKPKDFSKVPRDLLYKYNAYDVYYTFLLYRYFLPQVEFHEAFWTEISWANGFIDIEANRVKVDLDYVADFRDDLMAQEAEHLALLPEGLNPNSPKQIKEAILAAGVDVTGTDAKILKSIEDDPRVAHIVPPLLAYRKVNKQRSTYADAYLRHEVDGFIRPTINIHGTASGRMSGSEPNLQNIPRDKKVRHCFIARSEDRVLIEVDYSQAELRVQAVLSGDPDMIAAFQPGAGDFFDLLMPVAFPGKYLNLAAFKQHKNDNKADAKEDRAKIKGVVYGLNFGRGAAAIAEALKMPTQDAQDIIDNFMSAYPVYAKWREQVVEAAIDPEKRDFLTGPYGLTFDTEVVTWRNEGSVQRSALSFLPQNCVSYLCTTAAVRTNYRLKREHPEALVVLAVHDAIYVDCPLDIAPQVGAIVQEEMERVGVETFGTTVPFAAEPEWAYRWSDLVE
jgi:DNA polymerase-1